MAYDDDRPQKRSSSNELVLNPGEYAFLQDNTKGNVQTFVGPIVITQTGQLRPILFKEDRFSETSLQDAAVRCVLAHKGEYLILDNPTKEGEGLKHPVIANNNTSAPDLRYGEKIVVPGPVEFALWPQQAAILVGGHHLRPDQYLLVRVYDEEDAAANWSSTIAKIVDGDATEAVVSKTAEELNLSLGKLLVVKDVSFYIPPTGVEVVPLANGEYVRDALTLEMSEYAILVDSNGNKRYEPGPQIVFPAPTEEFFKENDCIKFTPIELTATQGLHIKINCDYIDTKWPTPDARAVMTREFREGDEIFITGATHPIYYPREEHSLVQYGNNLIHYATAVSAGQARYVMNKSTGVIETRHGPDMILLNPIEEVFVIRILSDAESRLMYPENENSLEYNQSLRKFQLDRGSKAEVLTGDKLSAACEKSPSDSATTSNQMTRKTKYTKPHSVALDDRFAGAPMLKVWTGYAVLLVRADGERRVEIGPKVVILDYDETMSPLHLSTGKPKTTDTLLTTGYLEMANNKVSDTLLIETSDGVHVNLKLSYRVSYVDDEKTWFNVDNYVKFLCDHCRSLLMGEARRHTIRGFYTDPVVIIRDTILGVKTDGTDRTGRLFKENGMIITDVEILGVTIADPEISSLLISQQQEVVTNQIAIDRSVQQLEVTVAEAENEKATLNLRNGIRQLKHKIELDQLSDHSVVSEKQADEALKRLQEQDVQAAQQRKIETADQDSELAYQNDVADLKLRQDEAETNNVVARFEAANGDLAAAIRQLGDEQLLQKVAEAMGPMRIIGGGTITDALAGLIGGKSELFGRLTSLVEGTDKDN